MTFQEASSLLSQDKFRSRHRKEIKKTIAWLERQREKKLKSYDSRIQNWKEILEEDEARKLQNYLG